MTDEKKKKKRWWIIGMIAGVCFVIVGLPLLGLILGVLLPAFSSGRRATNEASAVQIIKTISINEKNYFQTHHDYGTFSQLVADGNLDQRFTSDQPVIDGYIWTLQITPQSNHQPPAFAIHADPKISEGFSATGRRHFYLDSNDRSIHASEEQPATNNDPTLASQ